MPVFRERLVPGIGTLLACLLLVPGGLLVFLPIWPPAGVVAAVVLPAAAIGALVGLAPVIGVEDGVFVAGRARIDTGLTGPAESFAGSAAVVARGTGLDARAYTVLRGWVDPVVRVPIVDPDDPAPYWVISTRRPGELIGALDTARRRAGR